MTFVCMVKCLRKQMIFNTLVQLTKMPVVHQNFTRYIYNMAVILTNMTASNFSIKINHKFVADYSVFLVKI